jgi:hypothetical protein
MDESNPRITFEEPEKLRDWLLENGQLALLEEFFPEWVKDNFEEPKVRPPFYDPKAFRISPGESP